jgi:glycosyltransferase involved in cell wall biosynthesis
MGICSPGELAALLEGGHLLAVPSQYEGFGIVYLEAMGFGLPPLASAAGGARDLIRHGDNGYLIQPGESKSLANHIESLYNDREQLIRLSLAARRTFQAHPTWSDNGRVVRSFLRDLRKAALFM